LEGRLKAENAVVIGSAIVEPSGSRHFEAGNATVC
jgi:hypothetical protein